MGFDKPQSAATVASEVREDWGEASGISFGREVFKLNDANQCLLHQLARVGRCLVQISVQCCVLCIQAFTLGAVMFEAEQSSDELGQMHGTFAGDGGTLRGQPGEFTISINSWWRRTAYKII